MKPAVEFTFSYVNRKKKGLQLQGEFVGTQWELDFERMVSTSECLDPIRFAVRSFFPKERTTKTTKPHIDQPGAWHLMNVLFGPDTFCWEFAPAGHSFLSITGATWEILGPTFGATTWFHADEESVSLGP